MSKVPLCHQRLEWEQSRLFRFKVIDVTVSPHDGRAKARRDIISRNLLVVALAAASNIIAFVYTCALLRPKMLRLQIDRDLRPSLVRTTNPDLFYGTNIKQ